MFNLGYSGVASTWGRLKAYSEIIHGLFGLGMAWFVFQVVSGLMMIYLGLVSDSFRIWLGFIHHMLRYIKAWFRALI